MRQLSRDSCEVRRGEGGGRGCLLVVVVVVGEGGGVCWGWWWWGEGVVVRDAVKENEGCPMGGGMYFT